MVGEGEAWYTMQVHGTKGKRKSALLYAPRQMSSCKLYLRHTRVCLSSYIYVPSVCFSLSLSHTLFLLFIYGLACNNIRSEEFQYTNGVLFCAYTKPSVKIVRTYIHNASIHMWHRGIPIPISFEIFALFNAIQCLQSFSLCERNFCFQFVQHSRFHALRLHYTT